MKLSVLVVLSFLLEAHCGVLVSPESKEIGADLEQQRSARVHRVASDDFHENKDIHAKNVADAETTEQTFPPVIRQDDKSLANTVVPILSAESEASKVLASLVYSTKCFDPMEFSKHMESVNRILTELSREATVGWRNNDLAINGMVEAIESPVFIKSLPKSAHGLQNRLNTPELMDISTSDDLDLGKKTGPGLEYVGKTNDFQSRAIKSVGLYLDRLLSEIQDYATYIQNVIEKLCRKHRSRTPPQSKVDSSRKLS